MQCLVKYSVIRIQHIPCSVSFWCMLWRWCRGLNEEHSVSVHSRAKYILACQEDLEWVRPPMHRNKLLFIHIQTQPPSMHHHKWTEIIDIVCKQPTLNPTELKDDKTCEQLMHKCIYFKCVIITYRFVVAHNHICLISTRMNSSKESIDLFSTCLMYLGLWNISHQHCVLLGASNQGWGEVVPQLNNSLVSRPQDIVGHERNPKYSNEKCPYPGARRLHIHHHKKTNSHIRKEKNDPIISPKWKNTNHKMYSQLWKAPPPWCWTCPSCQSLCMCC